MKYIRNFKEHSIYEENKGTLEYPSLSYCEKENEVHYMPSNSVMFYVGDLSGKTDQTVVINYIGDTSDTVSIPEPNKWYTHVLPSGKTLSSVTNIDYIKEVVVNCDEAYAQNWKKVDKVSYYNCDILGGKFGDEFGYNNVDVTSLDIRTVDTSNVTDMYGMFSDCSNLTSLDLSNFNTSNVTTMENMFFYCTSLTSLDVSHFDTSNVTNMGYMFAYCSGLTSLDVSSFDTSNVTNIGGMFNGCSGLTSLDLSNFNTSNVTKFVLDYNESGLFNGCSSLKSLNVSSFDTSKANSMRNMFKSCRELTSIDVSNFDTSNVINMVGMFADCISLTSLDLSGWDTSKVTSMGDSYSYAGMFSDCYSLESLDLSGWDMTNVTNMSNMFENSQKLRTIRMVGCNQTTIDKINSVKPSDATIITE